MGGNRWCKNCHTSHERSTGRKHQKVDKKNQVDMYQADSGSQVTNISSQDAIVTEEQAREVILQVEGYPLNVNLGASTGDLGSG